MHKKIAAALAAGALALSVPAAAIASPWAGNSGHFKGSATPCKKSDNNPHCPPFGNG